MSFEQENQWALKIDFRARNFDNLKLVASEILTSIARAKNFKELPISGTTQTGFGQGRFEFSYRVECTSPVGARIAALRAEADAMQNTLQGAKK